MQSSTGTTDTERAGGAVSCWHGVNFPTGCTVAVVDDVEEARACVRELVDVGVPPADVQLATADKAIEMHRRQRGGARLLDRFIGALPTTAAHYRPSRSCGGAQGTSAYLRRSRASAICTPASLATRARPGQSERVRLSERADDLAMRLADVEWANRPRASRKKWAVALAIEMLVVLAIGCLVVARATDRNGIWAVFVGGCVWFGVFVWLLVDSPVTAFKWAICTLPIIPIAAIAAAYVTSR